LGDGQPERLAAIGIQPAFVRSSGHYILEEKVTDFETRR
jgi:hypothetical protein